ncbi:hypothetical protein BV898_20006 [Hypsibius exemplaris]|uniref:Uncharacterized protein n=1 Tax=Hypsibius exemplaris TaxID=2072580 RepID=A0A9X6NMI3_HYPEX|nr:hypothetical protein BV898_20006 [Hypsibius exemplaris]
MALKTTAGLIVLALFVSDTFAATLKGSDEGDEADPLLMLVKSNGDCRSSVIPLGSGFVNGLLSSIRTSGSTDEFDGRDRHDYGNPDQTVTFTTAGNDIDQFGTKKTNNRIIEHNTRHRNNEGEIVWAFSV